MAIVDVLKYNGQPDVFAWKYPDEELGTWTQLIVNESQEAVLYKGGMVYDVFGAGTYTLETQNIPLLNKLINLPFGGKSPFSAEVWYVNKAHSLNIKWGTPSPIQLQDAKYGIIVPVRAHGSFGIQIEDSKSFLVKMVGTLGYFDEVSITKYFRGIYVTTVKDAISSYLIKKQICVLEINAYLDELSAYLREQLAPIMKEYGIKLLTFNVNDISVPEDDPAIVKLRNALSKKAEMEIMGYNYQQERSFDTLESAASNEGGGASAFMGAGIGLGAGVGLGTAVGSEFRELSSNINTDSVKPNEKEEKILTCPNCSETVKKGQKFCHNCGAELGFKFCTECGVPLEQSQKFCHNCGTKTGQGAE